MTLTKRDRLFICGIGLAVVLACAVITLAQPADARDARSLSGYTIVHATGVNAKAHCPAGTRVLGGGGHENYNYTFKVRDVASVPLAYGAGWEYKMEAESGGWIVTSAFAICANL